MKVKGLNGREYQWKLNNKQVVAETRPRSSGHKLARELLKQLFPFEVALEEVTIPGCETAMYFDFVVVRQKLVVEVQGEQHRTYNPHFHRNPMGFVKQRRRDQAKRDWCAINGLKLVELHDNRIEEWPARIVSARVPDSENGEGED